MDVRGKVAHRIIHAPLKQEKVKTEYVLTKTFPQEGIILSDNKINCCSGFRKKSQNMQ